MDKNLLKFLACPKCLGDVSERGMFLTCGKCKLAFPVIEDVPDMMPKEAWKLGDAEKADFKHGMKL